MTQAIEKVRDYLGNTLLTSEFPTQEGGCEEAFLQDAKRICRGLAPTPRAMRGLKESPMMTR